MLAPSIHTSQPRRLDQMNTLRDMGRFPAAVNAGATANVLLTLCATWWVRPHIASHPLALPAWVSVVLFLNLMPVVALRAIGWRANASMPTVEQMNFAGDQHRFADWVYLAASANMAFWITLGWAAYTLQPAPWTLLATLALAFVCTFAPVWLRRLR